MSHFRFAQWLLLPSVAFASLRGISGPAGIRRNFLQKVPQNERVFKSTLLQLYPLASLRGISGPAGIRTRVIGSEGRKDGPDYPTGPGEALGNGLIKIIVCLLGLECLEICKEKSIM